jgi:hypothetical protein
VNYTERCGHFFDLLAFNSSNNGAGRVFASGTHPRALQNLSLETVACSGRSTVKALRV